MKKAVYTTLQDEKVVVEYDEEAPCRMCGKPVEEASMAGTDVCPWCDCGYRRDGTRWTFSDLQKLMNTEHKYIGTAAGHPP